MKHKFLITLIAVFFISITNSYTVMGQLTVDIYEPQQICYDSIADTLTSVVKNGTTPYTYSWESSPDSENWTAIQGADTSFYYPGQLTDSTYYRLKVEDSGHPTLEAISDTLLIGVYPELRAGPIDISNATITVCYGGDAGILRAEPTGGSGAYDIDWYTLPADSVGTGETLLLNNLTETAEYYFSLKDQCGLKLSEDTVKINVYGELVADSISGKDTVCYLDNTVLTAHYSGGSPEDSIVWFNEFDQVVGYGDTYTTGPLSSDVFYYFQYRGPCGADRSENFYIHVYDELTAQVLGETQICYEEQFELQADLSGGSGEFALSWYKEPGLFLGDQLTITINDLQDTTLFFLVVEDTGCGSDPDTLYHLVNVYDLLSAGAITGENTIICAGEDGGKLTAHPAGGSMDYSVEWYIKNEPLVLSTSLEYNTGALDDTTEFYYVVTDNNGCGEATSGFYTINVSSNLEAEVNIILPPGSICQGNTVTFTADPYPPSDELEYQWFIDDVEKSTQPEYTTTELEDGNTVKLTLTYPVSSCVTNSPLSESQVITVYPLPESAPLVAKPQGGFPVVLIYPANPEGKQYTYQWYKDGEMLNGADEKFYYQGGGLPYGDYSVIVSNEHDCEVELHYNHQLDKNMLLQPDDIFHVYPNPSRGEINLVLNDVNKPPSGGTVRVRICDLNGKTHYEAVLGWIDQVLHLPQLGKGMYIMEVRQGDRQQKRKIVLY